MKMKPPPRSSPSTAPSPAPPEHGHIHSRDGRWPWRLSRFLQFDSLNLDSSRRLLLLTRTAEGGDDDSGAGGSISIGSVASKRTGGSSSGGQGRAAAGSGSGAGSDTDDDDDERNVPSLELTSHSRRSGGGIYSDHDDDDDCGDDGDGDYPAADVRRFVPVPADAHGEGLRRRRRRKDIGGGGRNIIGSSGSAAAARASPTPHRAENEGGRRGLWATTDGTAAASGDLPPPPPPPPPPRLRLQRRTKLGQTIHWSARHHYEPQQLEPYRQIGDPEMDTLLDLIHVSTSREGGGPRAADGLGRFDDIVELSRAAHQKLQSSVQEEEDRGGSSGRSSSPFLPPHELALANLHLHYAAPPPWVDWYQLQRGMDLFLTYLPAAGTSLYYRSLIGGFSIPKITAVLRETQYLAPPSSRDRVRERLVDTGGFLACCMAEEEPATSPSASAPEAVLDVGGNNDGGNNDSSDRNWSEAAAASTSVPAPPSPLPAAALRPGGRGWAAALRVRHLHARVRRSILAHSCEDNDGKKKIRKKWDIDALGVPINQEDMAGTLLAFSVNVLVGIEFVAGAQLSEDQQRDYLALWRYLGWLLGVDTVEEWTEEEEKKEEEGVGEQREERSRPSPKHIDSPATTAGSRSSRASNKRRRANWKSSNPPIGGGGAAQEACLPPIDPCGGARPGGGLRAAAAGRQRARKDNYGGDDSDSDYYYDGGSHDDYEVDGESSNVNDVVDDYYDDDSITHSYATLESIVCHLLDPDDASGEVAAHLLNVGRSRGGVARRSPAGRQGSVKGAGAGDGGKVARRQGRQQGQGSSSSSSSFAYRYRCVMCRRFLGDPLADELALPIPARNTWEGWLLFTLTWVHLMVMRLYTLAAIRVPFVQGRVRRWHARGMTRFHFVWSEMHQKRMNKAAKEEGMTGGGSGESNDRADADAEMDVRKGMGSENNEGRIPKEGASSACPFSLVMPPT